MTQNTVNSMHKNHDTQNTQKKIMILKIRKNMQTIPRIHLESVEVGYSDIFLEYSIYLTTRSICLEYYDIYLEYVNPFPIPGIYLEYA